MDLKELLYSKIDQLGIDHIKLKIKSNIHNTEYIIKQLFVECTGSNDIQNLTRSDYISLAEGLMHYLLAITITPSQRKINICNTEVSILVPGASDLKKKSDKVVIIQFLKGDEVEYTKIINELLEIQPSFYNIWLISYRPIVTTFGLKNFVIDERNQNMEIIQPFSKVIIEINSFLNRINYTGFRII